MTLKCYHQVWCRLVHAFLKSPLAALEHPLKTNEKPDVNRHNSAADGLILFKFGTYIDHMTRHLPYVFKVKGSKVKVRV